MKEKLSFKENYLVFVKKNKQNVNLQVLIATILSAFALWVVYH